MTFNYTCGTVIKIKNSRQDDSPYAISSVKKQSESQQNNYSRDKLIFYTKIPKCLDPNLNITGYLSSLKIPYGPTMNQPWNVDPYFLDMMPLSTCCNMNESILIFGGLNPDNPDDFELGGSIFELHSTRKFWNYYGCMLEPRCYHATSLINSCIYITGGYSLLQRLSGEMLAVPYTDRLDIKTTLWKRCCKMNKARASHAMVAVKEYLYVFGGRDNMGRILDCVEMYNTNNNTWTEINYLPQPCMGLSAAVVDDDVWLLGGITTQLPEHQEQSILSDVYSFRPSNGRWMVEKQLPAPHAYSSAVFHEGIIWLVGGCHLSQEQSLISCSCIRQLSLYTQPQVWKLAASLPIATHACSAVLCDNKLYVFGGLHSQKKKALDVVQIINIDTGNLENNVLKLPAAIVGSKAEFLSKEYEKSTDLCECKTLHVSNKDSEDLVLKTQQIQSFKERLNNARKQKQSTGADSWFSKIKYSMEPRETTKTITVEKGTQVSDLAEIKTSVPGDVFSKSCKLNQPFVKTAPIQSPIKQGTFLSTHTSTKCRHYTTTLVCPVNAENSKENPINLCVTEKTELVLESGKWKSIVKYIDETDDIDFRLQSPPSQ